MSNANAYKEGLETNDWFWSLVNSGIDLEGNEMEENQFVEALHV